MSRPQIEPQFALIKVYILYSVHFIDQHIGFSILPYDNPSLIETLNESRKHILTLTSTERTLETCSRILIAVSVKVAIIGLSMNDSDRSPAMLFLQFVNSICDFSPSLLAIVYTTVC